jgi:hypothetical protein
MMPYHMRLLGDYCQPFNNVFPDTHQRAPAGALFPFFSYVYDFINSGNCRVNRFPAALAPAATIDRFFFFRAFRNQIGRAHV